VISFVPPTIHMPIAKACLKIGKHLVTSSYITAEMKQMDEQVKGKGLIFLNESGLDPGIDIMSTMKVVNEAKANGCKVVGYESYCGGIPVAEQADNPLGYKFSWNPGASIKAAMNKATFLKNKQVFHIYHRF
jgi:saccharopine dehydrogenase-like NADP-dependent oxidoreductase